MNFVSVFQFLASWTWNMLFLLTLVSGTFHLIVPALFLKMVDKAVILPEAHAVTVSITSSLQGEFAGVRDPAAGSTNPIMTPFIDCSLICIQGPLARWNLWPVRKRNVTFPPWLRDRTRDSLSPAQLLEAGSCRTETQMFVTDGQRPQRRSEASPGQKVRQIFCFFARDATSCHFFNIWIT